MPCFLLHPLTSLSIPRSFMRCSTDHYITPPPPQRFVLEWNSTYTNISRQQQHSRTQIITAIKRISTAHISFHLTNYLPVNRVCLSTTADEKKHFTYIQFTALLTNRHLIIANHPQQTLADDVSLGLPHCLLLQCPLSIHVYLAQNAS